MKSIKQFTSPLVAVICLVISLLVPMIRAYWIDSLLSASLYDALIFWFLFVGLTAAGINLVARYIGKSLLKMENHLVIAALREGNRFNLWFVFPLTILFEEILFRGFLLGLLKEFTPLAEWVIILIGAVIFSLYHLHTWPSFKDSRITIAFMSFSFLLGIACGYIMFTLGLIVAFLLHWLSVFLIFQNMAKKLKHLKPAEEQREVTVNYADNYLNFTAILAGISFTILFEYLGKITNPTWIDSFLIIAFTFSTTCFLIASAGYADCTKIKNGKIMRKLPGGKWEKIPVDYYENIHLPDQLTLIGFLIMLVALAISGFKNLVNWWWGIVTLIIALVALIMVFKIYPSHKKQSD